MKVVKLNIQQFKNSLSLKLSFKMKEINITWAYFQWTQMKEQTRKCTRKKTCIYDGHLQTSLAQEWSSAMQLCIQTNCVISTYNALSSAINCDFRTLWAIIFFSKELLLVKYIQVNVLHQWQFRHLICNVYGINWYHLTYIYITNIYVSFIHVLFLTFWIFI